MTAFMKEAPQPSLGSADKPLIGLHQLAIFELDIEHVPNTLTETSISWENVTSGEKKKDHTWLWNAEMLRNYIDAGSLLEQKSVWKFNINLSHYKLYACMRACVLERHCTTTRWQQHTRVLLLVSFNQPFDSSNFACRSGGLFIAITILFTCILGADVAYLN